MNKPRIDLYNLRLFALWVVEYNVINSVLCFSDTLCVVSILFLPYILNRISSNIDYTYSGNNIRVLFENLPIIFYKGKS